ncbi:MAG TPA: helix-turn-helix transcriptional regulator [Solirubrobacterales bacterium]
MTVAEQFGRNLFMARRRAYISQEALGRAPGLHRTHIGLLEKGTREPRLDTILKLADALGVEAGDLIFRIRRNAG